MSGHTYMNKQNDILLIYDKQCPACDNYCHLLRIRESTGTLCLINARDDHEILNEITAAGLDIDQGMVLKLGGVLYYGADAIHMLALLGSRSGVFNKINYWLFRSKILSFAFYPVLRFFRNLLLKILGRSKINNLNIKGNDRF